MKAILEFNLPEDNDEYKLTTTAAGMSSTLWNLDQWLRSNIKYSDDDSLDNDTLQAVRDKLYEIMKNNNISID